MAVEFTKSAEPLPGYRLIEPLGRGGFGEVWKAEAPGGLLKAIKLVYGTLRSGTGEEVLVQEELKALDKVKTVRHPYILSMDRYDILDGQLVIVMELADGNLWDRFKEHQGKGLPGIPRDELLEYMEEAAEALDLMNLQYGLQHSDIKPQNLFLVHRHIKVADFGLVKDLKDHKVLVSGYFSPIYAAPETFEGKVSQCSDQYSLAIVYQELLTGQRPFDGTNPRMLLMQHLKHPPTLSSLPARDQTIIAKALAKNAGDRFKSCMELVETLMDAGRQPITMAPAPVADDDEVNLDAPPPLQESQGNTIIIPKKHQLPPLPAAAAADYKSRTTVDISCPSCGFTGRVPKKYQGLRVKCPQCS
jgi:serine/threonine protein kinase